jgi:hypothetical protein
MTILEPEEFQRWKDSQATKEFLSLLSRRRSNLMEAWAAGQPLAPEQQAQAVLLGQLSRVQHDDVLDMAGVEVSDDNNRD